ncbi:hypothetical protein MZM54_04345 [[Brevibacterium] frigoritolerans]|nr:hypothetical protein [Peribacillus frigoritolerans]
MNSFEITVRDHFYDCYKEKNYLQYLSLSESNSPTISTIHWFLPDFMDINFWFKQISDVLNFDKYPGGAVPGITCCHLLDHPTFSSVISVEIHLDSFNKLMVIGLIQDLDGLIEEYEKIYEITKIFSVNGNGTGK